MGGGMRGPGRRMQGGTRIENPGKVFKRLMAYIFKNYGIHFIFVLICIVLSVVASIQGTLFMQRLIDDYIMPMIGQKTPDFGNLFREIVRVAGFYLVGVAATYAYNRIMVTITQGTLKNLRDDLFEHMEKLPIKYFDTHSHGDIMSIYTNDIDTLRQMISQSIPQVFSSFITVVGTLGSMLVLSIPLTAVSLIMVALMMFVTGKVAGLSGKYFVKQQKNIGTVNGYIEEMMEGQKVVKVFCHEEESMEGFDRLNDQLFDSANNANKFANILMPINAQLGNISYVLCAMVGGILALNGIGGFTIGGLVSFLTFNKSFSMPINQVSQQMNAIVMALAGAERIFTLLDEKVEVDDGYVTLVNVKKENGKWMIFATQRGYGEFKDGWEFPGGKIEEGETPQDALKREISEELDTEISVGELIDTIEYDYPTFHLSMDCFWCEIVKGDLVLKEHEAARWLNKKSIDNVEWLPADITLIEKVREKL